VYQVSCFYHKVNDSLIKDQTMGVPEPYIDTLTKLEAKTKH